MKTREEEKTEAEKEDQWIECLDGGVEGKGKVKVCCQVVLSLRH